MQSAKTTPILFIVLLVVGVVIGYPIGYYMAPPKIEEKIVEKPVYPLKGEIPIGVIVASTPNLETERATVEIAIEEVNNYFKTLGLPITFKAYIENAEGSATKAFEKLQSLYAKGIRIVLGWRWSSHIRACYDYIQANKILVISDGSTSPLLSIADDFVFRLPTPDTVQGVVIPKIIVDYGVKAIAVLQRADTWGDGLYAVVEENFKKLGGTIVERVRYDPEKTEFSAELAILASKIDGAIKTYGKDKVGFLLLAFDEAAVIQSQAKDYPALMSVLWFGSDGHVVSDRLVNEAGRYAYVVRHICTYVTITNSTLWMSFAEKHRAKVGYVPGTYSTCLYDSVWLVAKAILEAATTDTTVLKKILPEVAAKYFGASGWCLLDKNGDRAAMDYDIWAVVKESEIKSASLFTRYYYNVTVDGERLAWAIVGSYSAATGSIKWLFKPTLAPKAAYTVLIGDFDQKLT
ncbi:MAG: ABC transporter substrate-binding protein [Candidatus Verstraetearchaeota archaeon]|nr:ABC transporter substrate-binding protein [Candidatus Verstraetearchaeota archaeon]